MRHQKVVSNPMSPLQQRAWYNNLEPNSIEGFSDLCAKLVARFSTSIPTKKTFTKLFSVAWQEGESTQVYLRRFNTEMLKVKELIEPVALEALKRRVREHVLWRKLYVLPDRSLSKVKQFMENHIWVEEVSLLRHEPPCIYKDNHHQ
jgi:hypothetical protein